MQRRPKHLPLAALTLALTGLLSTPAGAETNTDDRLKALEQRLDTLESENRALKDQMQQTEQKIEATGSQMDRIASQGGSTTTTSFGGYGELHLNKLKNRKAGGSNKDELDLHRKCCSWATSSTRRRASSPSWKSSTAWPRTPPPAARAWSRWSRLTSTSA